MEINFPSLPPSSANQGMKVKRDSSMNKILKIVHQLKSLSSQKRCEKYEELIRYIMSIMLEKKSDSLLQTTSLWSLLNLIQLDSNYTIQIMLKVGLPGVLYEILKGDNQSEHTKQYASQLISALCSTGQEYTNNNESISLQGSILKSGLNEFSIDSTSENESGLASFAPYYIEEKNVELLNNLFQEETLWRDLNDSHKLGTALEQESIHGDSITNQTATSSLSDFWEVMNQRYIYPDNQSIHEKDNRPSSITRNKLLSATHQSRLLNSAYNSQRNTPSRNRTRSTRSERKITQPREDRPSTFSPSKNIKLKPFLLKSPPHVTQTSSIPPQEAIVPDHLVHLDPLSLNVTTSLKGLGKMEQQTLKNTRKYSHQSEIMGDFVEQRSRNVSFDGTIASTDDQTHTTQNSWEDESAGNTAHSNYYFTRNDKKKLHKQRISAEELKDMTFMRNFFIQKATIADTHDLINRMQDILELMDKDETGYVSWKSFTRVLLSVAPKHLLRSDVTSFLAAQVDCEDDLINYKEFVITGKVLIIESKEGVKEVLARSWYARQRGNKALAEGDSSSMYTWKNHLKWYSKRKSDAVIWLIRRANRAIQYYKYVETARVRLVKYGKWGKDLAYLLECGERALQAIESSEAIRISLQDRIVHAKKYKMKREEARRCLYIIGQASLREGLQTVTKKKDEPTKSTSHVVFPKLSQIYKIKYLKENAFRVLLKYSKMAKEKVEFRDNAFLFLQNLGKKILFQQEVLANVHNQLVTYSDEARNYCMILDSALIYLLTRGERALKHFDRQTATLDYLIKLGQRSIIFTEKKQKVAQELSTFAQTIFVKLNRRENSFAYLCKRAKNSQKLLNAKKEAYWMLTGFMRRIYENEENLMKTFLWLKKRADRAKKHTESCLKAHRRLKTIAQRSVAVSRARSMAHADLKQIGQQALRKQFEDTWVVLPGNKQRLNDETKRIKTNDKRLRTTRADLPEEERWKVVLMDAFVGLASAYTKELLAHANSEQLSRSESMEPSSTRNRPNSPESSSKLRPITPPRMISESSKRPSSPESIKVRPSSPEASSKSRPGSGSNKFRPGTAASNTTDDLCDGLELGRLGFKKLILDGKLLGLPKGTADSCYESVDSDASGCVSFSEVWTWFLYQARAKSKKSPGSVNFHIEDILSPKERAITALMKRFIK